MNFASDQAMYELAGWTLIHFLWQGVLVAVAVWLLLQMFSRRAANLRYLVLCGGLASLAPGCYGSMASRVMAKAATGRRSR